MTNDSGRVPLWCPICQLVMKGDNTTYFRWGCCKLCHIQFVEDREERWDGGWRPSLSEVESFIDGTKGYLNKS